MIISSNKKILMSLVASSLLVFPLLAENKQSQEKEGSGFAFYDDITSEKNPKKRDIGEILSRILKEQEKQTKIQEKILALMESQYDVPKMVKVNGKECLANSSVDCFVMPIAGDAKRIPVMKKWIENPTMENAIAYYRWQSVYLNKIFNAGYSYHTASMSIEHPFKGIPTYMEATGGYETTRQMRFITEEIIRKHAKEMKILILIGENIGFDIENNQSIFNIFDNFSEMGVSVYYVFKSQKALKDFNEVVKAVPTKSYQERWAKIDDKYKLVSPNTYKGNENIEVHITPMYILKYDSKDKHFSQVLGAGRDDFEGLMEALPRSLIYWDIEKPSEFSASKANRGQINDTLENLGKKKIFEDDKERERAEKFKEKLKKEMSK